MQAISIITIIIHIIFDIFADKFYIIIEFEFNMILEIFTNIFS